MSSVPLRVVAALIGLLCAPVVASAQTGTTDGEWRFYNGDAGSTRYAPFDQINKDTVKDLTIAWRWKPESPGPRPETNYQATPLGSSHKCMHDSGMISPITRRPKDEE